MIDATKATDPGYDYIVVGSGAGGAPVAARLARAGMRVLVLEAGSDAEPYNYRVPVFHPLASEDPSLCWNYFVRHYADDERQRRDSKFVASEDGVLYPRSGTLGGCTAHNAMITVYPFSRYWDEIAAVTGDESWRGVKMRRYFERLEDCRYQPFQRLLSHLGINPERRGFGGWLCTEVALPTSALWDHELLTVLAKSASDAIGKLGHELDRLEEIIDTWADPNAWKLQHHHPEGVFLAPLATRNHSRNGARELLRRVQREHPDRLTILTNCLATRIVFDDSLRAIGVDYLRGEHLYGADPAFDRAKNGSPQTARAEREVIVSAGAFNSPQLLMLSGVGPAAELGRFGIRPVSALEGVGKNLQDRYEVGVVNRLKRDWKVLDGATFAAGDPLFEQWQKSGEGVYGSNGAVLTIIKRSDALQPLPDLFLFALLGKFTGYYPGYSKLFADHHNYITWAILKAHTRNTAGEITLRSTDPRERPAINFRYFEEGNDASGDDLDTVVDGIEFVRSLEPALREYVDAEETPGDRFRTRDELKQFVRDNAWGHHASCTCRIGRAGDGSVVDSRFRVHGTRGLRVVDASVFPRIPGFFIVTSVYMVGEKAADVILEDAKHAAAARR